MATHVQRQKSSLPNVDLEGQTTQQLGVASTIQAQLLRVSVLGLNLGLLSSTASLLMVIVAAPSDVKTLILKWVVATVAGGACAKAIREFFSVYSQIQYDIEIESARELEEEEEEKKKFPSPFKTAAASAASFAVGAFVPLLPAVFIKDDQARLVGLGVVTVSFALLGFGGLIAALGRAPLVKSLLIVSFGEWLAMVVTFGLTKFAGSIKP